MKCNVCQIKVILGLELRVKGLLCTRNLSSRARKCILYTDRAAKPCFKSSTPPAARLVFGRAGRSVGLAKPLLTCMQHTFARATHSAKKLNSNRQAQIGARG